MKTWNDISLHAFQQIEQLNKRTDLEELDRTLLIVCAAYDLTPDELDRKGARKALKMAECIGRIFESPFTTMPCQRIGCHDFNFDIESYTFGQYIECAYFLQNPNPTAHYILSSGCKDQKSDHKTRAEYFLQFPVTVALGTVNLLSEKIAAFNSQFPALFGLNETQGGKSKQEHSFNKRYGWIYSASQVAKHEGITLEQTYNLPVRRALNALDYLKAEAEYMDFLTKSKP